MQVSSLSAGSSISIPVPKEPKQQPLPMERREAAPQATANNNAGLRAETLAGAFNSSSQKPQALDLKQVSSELEHISLAFNRRLKFVIDQDSRDLIVKVIDNETDKVIKVLPPEELQRLHSRIRETMGFLFDRMV